jgi:hypothetical protein
MCGYGGMQYVPWEQRARRCWCECECTCRARVLQRGSNWPERRHILVQVHVNTVWWLLRVCAEGWHRITRVSVLCLGCTVTSTCVQKEGLHRITYRINVLWLAWLPSNSWKRIAWPCFSQVAPRSQCPWYASKEHRLSFAGLKLTLIFVQMPICFVRGCGQDTWT